MEPSQSSEYQYAEKKSRFKVKNVTPEDGKADQITIGPANDPENKPFPSLNYEEKESISDQLNDSQRFQTGGPKKSRFTVKAVSKDEQPRPNSNNVSADPTTTTTITLDVTKGNTEASSIVLIETIQQQSIAIQRLERVVELNHQTLMKICDSRPPPVISNGTDQVDTSTFRDKSVSESHQPQFSFIQHNNVPGSSNAKIQPEKFNGIAVTSHQPISNIISGPDKDKISEKDKSFGKLSHYLTEMKKELDISNRQRKEMQLETQRLHEKCQQLEDYLTIEQTKVQALEERLEKSKINQKYLQSQIESYQLTIAKWQLHENSQSNRQEDIEMHHKLSSSSDCERSSKSFTTLNQQKCSKTFLDTNSLSCQSCQNSPVVATPTSPSGRDIIIEQPVSISNESNNMTKSVRPLNLSNSVSPTSSASMPSGLMNSYRPNSNNSH